MCIHICLARSLHEKSHINVYLQTRLMIYVLVQCSILCSFKISIHINVCYKHVIYKQLLDEVFVMCRIINVEVRVISRAEGEADNSYRDIDNFAYQKNRIQ